MPLFKFDGPDGPEAYAVEKGPNGLLRWHLAEARQTGEDDDAEPAEVDAVDPTETPSGGETEAD